MPRFCLQYPREVKHFQYDPYFAIRGLHLDVKKVSNCLLTISPLYPIQGYLMKVDANNHIQLGSVYRYGTTHTQQHACASKLIVSTFKNCWSVTLFACGNSLLILLNEYPRVKQVPFLRF